MTSENWNCVAVASFIPPEQERTDRVPAQEAVEQPATHEERTVRLVELQHQLRNDLLGESRPNSVVRLAEQLFSIPVVTAGRSRR